MIIEYFFTLKYMKYEITRKIFVLEKSSHKKTTLISVATLFPEVYNLTESNCKYSIKIAR